MTIGVIFGSKSPEHDVSIITGQLIISELKKTEHQVVPIYLGKNAEWYIDDSLGKLSIFKTLNEDTLKGFSKYYLDLELSQGKLVFRKKGLVGKEITVDLAFPAVHGAYGEDGTLQGMLEMFNVPYVGCDVPASALAMDKILTKVLYKAHGIQTSKFTYFNQNDWSSKKTELLDKIEAELSYPLFVKPPKLGSSIGIEKVSTRQGLEFAIEVALHYGERVLVEEGVNNLKDLTCAVMGNSDPIASLVQESRFDADFFNYEEKYLKDGGAQLGNADKSIIIPAEIPEAVSQEIQKQAKEIYTIFGCSGIARVDFLYDAKQEKLYANEINTLPGTLYHHLWKASGIELDKLVADLVRLAEEKHLVKQSFTNTFNSKLLEQANSSKLQVKG